eukprot:5650365-Alexandrium_andersonii.AAC.1
MRHQSGNQISESACPSESLLLHKKRDHGPPPSGSMVAPRADYADGCWESKWLSSSLIPTHGNVA